MWCAYKHTIGSNTLNMHSASIMTSEVIKSTAQKLVKLAIRRATAAKAGNRPGQAHTQTDTWTCGCLRMVLILLAPFLCDGSLQLSDTAVRLSTGLHLQMCLCGEIYHVLLQVNWASIKAMIWQTMFWLHQRPLAISWGVLTLNRSVLTFGCWDFIFLNFCL